MRRDPLLRLLLVWVTLLTTVLWLPLIRGPMNGAEYEWAIGPIGGTGIGGDYWKLLAALAVVLVLQFTGRRGPRVLFPVLLLPLLVAFDAGIIQLAATDPDGLRLEGATLGFDISLTYILPVIFTLFVLLAIWWTISRARQHRFVHGDLPWTKRNWILLGLAAGLLSVQFALFRFGGDSGNQIGVFLTLIQWFVLNTGLNAPTVAPPPEANPLPFPPP